MPQYLLDTNIIIYLLKNPHSSLNSKLKSIPIGDLSVCSVVKAELFFGSEKSQYPEKNRKAQKSILNHLYSYPFDDNASVEYGKIRAELEKKGTIIGGNDLMIASIALVNDLILVTANEKEFSRIQNLKVENWL